MTARRGPSPARRLLLAVGLAVVDLLAVVLVWVVVALVLSGAEERSGLGDLAYVAVVALVMSWPGAVLAAVVAATVTGRAPRRWVVAAAGVAGALGPLVLLGAFLPVAAESGVICVVTGLVTAGTAAVLGRRRPA